MIYFTSKEVLEMNEFKNIIVKCQKDDNFEHSRNVEYSCGCEFILDEDNVYFVSGLDYFGEEKKDYYTICPMCGYINALDKNILPQKIKDIADLRSSVEAFSYRKNNLRSELIYLDRIAPKVLKKVL